MKSIKNIVALLLAILATNVAIADVVSFSGVVSTSCSFRSSLDGVLDATTNGSMYRLSSMYGAGRPAALDFDYTGTPTLSLTAVPYINYTGSGSFPAHEVYTEASFLNADNELIAVSSGFHGFTTGTKTMQMSGTTNHDVMFINLVVTASSPFPLGNISANAVITCQ